MKMLSILVLSTLPVLTCAGQAPVKEPVPEAAVLDRLERIALPIGKGAILQDRHGCLWSVMEGEKAPRLVALTNEANKPLCRSEAEHAVSPVQAPAQQSLPTRFKM